MVSLKKLSNHIKSVDTIGRLTTTMKMVAVAKFIRGEMSLLLGRPLGKGTQHFYKVTKIGVDPAKHKCIVLAMTSDRGLCGAMHSKVVKEIRTSYYPLGVKISNNSLVCVGEKSRSSLQMDSVTRNDIVMVVNGVGHKSPTFRDASRIATQVLRQDYIYGNIVFCQYKNILSFKVTQNELYTLPLLASASQMLVYETEVEDIISFLEFSTAALIFLAMLETYATEQASRIAAMASASKNANKIKSRLQREFNKKRQSSITNELIDIVSGANVVNTK